MSRDPVPIQDLLIHAEFVRGLAHDLVRDEHAGDDLVQEAWVQAMRRPPRHGASLRGWLATLVGSLFANRTREERRRRAREAAMPRPPDADPAERIVAAEQVRQRLLAAVMRLDEPFRTAVLLRYYDELSPAEIAARLAVPAATVRTRVLRGLERLRHELDREHHGDRTAWALPLAALPRSAPPPLPLVVALAMKKVALVVAAALLAAVSVVLAWFALAERPPTVPGTGLEGGAPADVATAATPSANERTAAVAAVAAAAAAGLPEAATDRADVERDASGELLVTVCWADGSPAAGVQVYVSAKSGGGRALASLRSDPAGHGRVRVPVGIVIVTADRQSDGVDATIVAGASSEARLGLTAGIDVDGVVRDAHGALVAGAQIWLTSQQAPWRAMAAVAESDVQGRFAVRAATADQSLGATAAGHGPSALVDLESIGAHPGAHLELVLATGGSSLAGCIVDEAGKGVADAVIAVGHSGRLDEHGADGRTHEKWRPRCARTDAAGNYRCDGLAPGDYPVEVWAAAFPFWHGKATLAADATTRLDITLPRGVLVHGSITDAKDAPLAGAIVRAYPAPIDESFLMTGQYDYDSIFGNAAAVADDAGKYRLTGVAPGEVQLYAGPAGKRSFGGVVPWAHATVQTAAGATIEWNAKVEPGPTIQGVVRFRDGPPMAHHFVSITVPGEKKRQSVVTDEQGRFRFLRLQPRGHDVSVQVWDPPKGAPPLEARDVWPDRGELVLTATYDAPRRLAAGTVRGTIVDAAGRAANPAAMRVLLTNDDRSWNTHEALVDGRFRFTDVGPGKKRLVVMYEDAPIHVGEPFELQPAEDKDFGVITTQPGGKLTLLIDRGPGTENLEPEAWLRPGDSMHSRKVALGKATRVEVDNLCVGKHTVSVWNAGIIGVSASANVVAGGDGMPVRLTLRAAATRELVVHYTAEQRLTGIHVVEAGGAEVWSYEPDRVVDRPCRMQLRLPLGRFECRVTTAGGGVANVDIVMTTLDADQPPIVVQAK